MNFDSEVARALEQVAREVRGLGTGDVHEKGAMEFSAVFLAEALEGAASSVGTRIADCATSIEDHQQSVYAVSRSLDKVADALFAIAHALQK